MFKKATEKRTACNIRTEKNITLFLGQAIGLCFIGRGKHAKRTSRAPLKMKTPPLVKSVFIKYVSDSLSSASPDYWL